jgi:hypothetical protein
MQRFFTLEKVIRRAPLGMRFLDMVRGVSITDGLVVTAWPVGAGITATRQAAYRSPLSGIYGFRSLPGLESFERGQSPATDWCASPPDVGQPTVDELENLGALQTLIGTDEGVSAANFVVFVQDSMERFLPQVLLMCLPKEKLIEVPLFSAPTRIGPAGFGVVRGEVWVLEDSLPASWAMITASLDAMTTYVTIADARGMFTLFVPYASALPALTGSPPHGSGTIGRLTWTLTIQVFYQALSVVPGAGLPDIRSILGQTQALIYIGGSPPTSVASLTCSISLGQDVVVKTDNLSRLYIAV